MADDMCGGRSQMLRGPVLVGTDMTTGAGEALRQGAQLASELGGRLVVCHVMPATVGTGSCGAARRCSSR